MKNTTTQFQVEGTTIFILKEDGFRRNPKTKELEPSYTNRLMLNVQNLPGLPSKSLEDFASRVCDLLNKDLRESRLLNPSHYEFCTGINLDDEDDAAEDAALGRPRPNALLGEDVRLPDGFKIQLDDNNNHRWVVSKGNLKIGAAILGRDGAYVIDGQYSYRLTFNLLQEVVDILVGYGIAASENLHERASNLILKEGFHLEFLEALGSNAFAYEVHKGKTALGQVTETRDVENGESAYEWRHYRTSKEDEGFESLYEASLSLIEHHGKVSK